MIVRESMPRSEIRLSRIPFTPASCILCNWSWALAGPPAVDPPRTVDSVSLCAGPAHAMATVQPGVSGRNRVVAGGFRCAVGLSGPLCLLRCDVGYAWCCDRIDDVD